MVGRRELASAARERRKEEGAQQLRTPVLREVLFGALHSEGGEERGKKRKKRRQKYAISCNWIMRDKPGD